MIPVEITYFEVSPQTVFEGKTGHMVKLAYKFDLDDDLLNSELVRYCDFVEDIVFKLEWKKPLSATENILLKEKELAVYPKKRFMLTRNNHRSAYCFLSKDFLTYESSLRTLRPELFCRISLRPILTTIRQSISYDPHDPHYLLSSSTEGNPADFILSGGDDF